MDATVGTFEYLLHQNIPTYDAQVGTFDTVMFVGILSLEARAGTFEDITSNSPAMRHVWDGSQWVRTPEYVWNGSTWVQVS